MTDWQTAYATVAEVAATLNGLLFVSLSVKLNAASMEERKWMLFVAQRSFLDFLAILAMGLLFLMPDVSLHGIGFALLWLGLARIAWHVAHWRTYRASSLRESLLKEYLAPITATVLLMIAGVAALLVWSSAPSLTYAAVIMLLFGACQNAWRLLVR